MKRILLALLMAASVQGQEQKATNKKTEMQNQIRFENMSFIQDRTTQSEEKRINLKTEAEGSREGTEKIATQQESVSDKVQQHPEQSNGGTGKVELAPEIAAKAVHQTAKEEVYSLNRLYGPSQYDSRIEIAQLQADNSWQLAIRQVSESVGMIIEKEQLVKISESTYQLNAVVTLGNRYNLCDGEAFANQLVVGVGTAFIIDRDIMVTAAHVFQRPLKDYAVVFGYRVINSLGTAETGIPASDVYFPINLQQENNELDVVRFQTDREFSRPVLQWEQSKALSEGTEIYMLGYPMGLPEKLAINADITDNSFHYYFYTSLDSFQGNSGSPIFNYETHKVIGVLVSGMTDYELKGDCYQSTLCKGPNCVGEKAIRIEMVFDP